jgi:hypothetical protein
MAAFDSVALYWGARRDRGREEMAFLLSNGASIDTVDTTRPLSASEGGQVDMTRLVASHTW